MRTFNEVLPQDRTCYHFLDTPVSIDLLKSIYEQVKFGPTSANTCPLRVLFCTTNEAREKLLSTLFPGNVDKSKSAPVNAILAYDTKFYEHMDKLFPHNPEMQRKFADNPNSAEQTAINNAWLQAGYFILAVRAAGLGCGPMGGFNKEMADKILLQNTSWKSIMICNIGYKDSSFEDFPRLPRLDFNEACQII